MRSGGFQVLRFFVTMCRSGEQCCFCCKQEAAVHSLSTTHSEEARSQGLQGNCRVPVGLTASERLIWESLQRRRSLPQVAYDY